MTRKVSALLKSLSTAASLSFAVLAACGGDVLSDDRDACTEFIGEATPWDADVMVSADTASADRCEAVGGAIAWAVFAELSRENLKVAALACKDIVLALGGTTTEVDAGASDSGESTKAWCERATQSIASSPALSHASLVVTEPAICAPSESARSKCASCLPSDVDTSRTNSWKERCDALADMTGTCGAAKVSISGANVGMLTEQERTRLEDDLAPLAALTKRLSADTVNVGVFDLQGWKNLRAGCEAKAKDRATEGIIDSKRALTASAAVIHAFR